MAAVAGGDALLPHLKSLVNDGMLIFDGQIFSPSDSGKVGINRKEQEATGSTSGGTKVNSGSVRVGIGGSLQMITMREFGRFSKREWRSTSCRVVMR